MYTGFKARLWDAAGWTYVLNPYNGTCEWHVHGFGSRHVLQEQEARFDVFATGTKREYCNLISKGTLFLITKPNDIQQKNAGLSDLELKRFF